MNELADGTAQTVVVTTDREVAHPARHGLSTIEVAADLARQNLCTHLHAPTATGVKSDQLNWAARQLCDRGYDPASTYLLIYDADSRPGADTLNAFWNAIAECPQAPVLHTSSWFEHRPTGDGGRRHWFADAAAVRASRFVLGFEIPRLLARNADASIRRRLARGVFAHVTGHGLCVRLDYLLAHPLPAGDPIEDMHWSFHICARGDTMIPVPDLDRAEVPTTITTQYQQARRWFSGPGRSLHYAVEGNEPLTAHRLTLALSGMASAGEWLGCAVVPALLGVSIVCRRHTVAGRAAGAVAGLLLAQMVAVDTTIGHRSARDAAGALLLLPVAYTVHGLGGLAGALDIARSRYRTDKTERG